jgi:hypothetical protein
LGITREIVPLAEIWTTLHAAAPPEAWFALIGVLTGALLALVGVWLTNRSSIQRLVIQLQHERDVREHENMRLRHEELYVESRKYLGAIVSYFLPYRMVMKGELTFNQALDMTIHQGQSRDHQPHRVTMLIDLYFPELKAEFDEVMAVRNKLVRLVDGYKQQYKTGDLDSGRWLKLFQPLLELLGTKATQFENRVAVFGRDA